MAATRYLSFLVRMWREEDPNRPGRFGEWQGEVEHIQSGRHWTFARLEELLDFLRRQTAEPGASGWSVQG